MKRKFTFLIAAIALMAFLVPNKGWGQTTASVTFSEQGFSNSESLDGVTIALDGNIYCTFDKGAGNNPPAYYNTGTAARLYGGNTLTVTPASGATITGMTLTFSAAGYTGSLSPSVGTYTLSSTTGTWSGSSSAAVVITNTASSGHARLKELAVTYTTGGSTTTPTTVTIDDSGITNNDVYVGTAAGTLTATVKDNSGNLISGATVAWTSSNTGVATIDDAGAVTLVAAGTTTITASYAGDATYDSSSSTYDFVVVDNTPSTDQWVLTNLADLTSTDVFVIVGNGTYAMSNDNGTTSAPVPVAVTISGNNLTGTIAANIQWNIAGNATDGYSFLPNGTTTYLFCNTNAGSCSINN